MQKVVLHIHDDEGGSGDVGAHGDDGIGGTCIVLRF